MTATQYHSHGTVTIKYDSSDEAVQGHSWFNNVLLLNKNTDILLEYRYLLHIISSRVRLLVLWIMWNNKFILNGYLPWINKVILLFIIIWLNMNYTLSNSENGHDIMTSDYILFGSNHTTQVSTWNSNRICDLNAMHGVPTCLNSSKNRVNTQKIRKISIPETWVLKCPRMI